VGKQEAFRSLTLLVAVCEQALLELEAAQVKVSDDLAAKIEATRDAAVETLGCSANRLRCQRGLNAADR
jgi:hypothetical protein